MILGRYRLRRGTVDEIHSIFSIDKKRRNVDMINLHH